MNVWILEDEPRAARRLQRLLEQVSTEAKVVAQFDSLESAGPRFEAGDFPDVILSDIELADGLSFALYDAYDVPCPVVFTTAYDQYALKAFQSNGVDYLLKPVTAEALNAALSKAQKLASSSQALPIAEMMALLQPPAQRFRERFMVRIGDRLRSIPAEEVACIYADQKVTMLRADGRDYVLDYPLDQLMPELDPKAFFRISRKFIVAYGCIERSEAYSNSRFKVVIRDWERNDLVVSRERSQEFKRWLGG